VTGDLQARLHHLSLFSPNPERLADFYRRAFSMRMERQRSTAGGEIWICHGRQRCLIIQEGVANTLAWAGYALEDEARLQALRHRLAAAGIAEIVLPSAFLFEPSAVAFADPDGNRMIFGCLKDGEPVEEGLAGRLQHIVVASRDPARLIDFYTRIVGFRESDRVLDDQGGLRTCFLRSDPEHHSFAVFLANRDRLDHHCYEAEDWMLIRDWGDHFASLRVPVQWGPGRHGPGNNLFLFVHDPDGNWVEISAELEIVPDGRPTGTWKHEERTLNSWGQAFLRS